MQKRASFARWAIAFGSMIRAALNDVIRVSGTFNVAGSFGERGSVEVATPRSALRVAYERVTCHANVGPDEHREA